MRYLLHELSIRHPNMSRPTHDSRFFPQKPSLGIPIPPLLRIESLSFVSSPSAPSCAVRLFVDEGGERTSRRNRTEVGELSSFSCSSSTLPLSALFMSRKGRTRRISVKAGLRIRRKERAQIESYGDDDEKQKENLLLS
jgi:hypothetical protein